MKKIIKGRSVITHIHDAFYSNTFHEVDNLDTKSLDEAENNYEATFITIRSFLQEQKDMQHNLASESTILSITQNIADLLHKGLLIRKD